MWSWHSCFEAGVFQLSRDGFSIGLHTCCWLLWEQHQFSKTWQSNDKPLLRWLVLLPVSLYAGLTPQGVSCHLQLCAGFIVWRSSVLGQTGVKDCLRKGAQSYCEDSVEDVGNSQHLIASGSCKVVPLELACTGNRCPSARVAHHSSIISELIHQLFDTWLCCLSALPCSPSFTRRLPPLGCRCPWLAQSAVPNKLRLPEVLSHLGQPDSVMFASRYLLSPLFASVK